MTNPSAISSGMRQNRNEGTAIFALTRKGTELAAGIKAAIPGSTCFCNSRYALPGMVPMEKTAESLASAWRRYGSIICIMGCGIVVRTIAPLLGNKMTDPAVVVVDEDGKFAVSLVSGHLGGANELALKVAAILGAQAVITTASDLRGKPAIDLIAQKAGLEIENPGLLSRIAAAVLDDEPVWLFDPENLFTRHLPPDHGFVLIDSPGTEPMRADTGKSFDSVPTGPGVWVSEALGPSREDCLKLRPLCLVVGVGCNRGTEADEIIDLIREVLLEGNLSPLSIRNFATVDIKADEPGLLEAAGFFGRPIEFFKREEIRGIPVPNPSRTVAHHIGAESVCEASALRSAGTPHLSAPKHKSKNCTAAIARVSCS